MSVFAWVACFLSGWNTRNTRPADSYLSYKLHMDLKNRTLLMMSLVNELSTNGESLFTDIRSEPDRNRGQQTFWVFGWFLKRLNTEAWLSKDL